MIRSLRSVRHRDNTSRNRRDVIRRFAAGGCPPCQNAVLSARQWVRAFANETNADDEVLAKIRAARGFCPAHLRFLLARGDAPFLLPATLWDLASARLADLSAGHTQASGDGCLLCRAQHRAARDTVAAIATVGDDPTVLAALRDHGQLCLRHTIGTVAATSPKAAPAVLASFTERYAQTSGVASLDPMTGEDADAGARHKQLAALVDAVEQIDAELSSPAVRRAIALIDQPSCPSCRARGAGAVRYLRWLCTARGDPEHGLDPLETALCSRHLFDLSGLDPLTAGWIADFEHPIVANRLDKLAAALTATSDMSISVRLVDMTTSPLGPRSRSRRRVHGKLAAYRRTIRQCPACRAATVAEARTTDLIAAALPDRQVRHHLADSHGLCVEHAPVVAARTDDSLPTTVLRARLQTLAWELAESRRKREWWVRHEPQGREMSSWRRAPTLLAGDTYAGLGPDE